MPQRVIPFPVQCALQFLARGSHEEYPVEVVNTDQLLTKVRPIITLFPHTSQDICYVSPPALSGSVEETLLSLSENSRADVGAAIWAVRSVTAPFVVALSRTSILALRYKGSMMRMSSRRCRLEYVSSDLERAIIKARD